MRTGTWLCLMSLVACTAERPKPVVAPPATALAASSPRVKPAPPVASAPLEIRMRPVLDPPRVEVEIRARGKAGELSAWTLGREGQSGFEIRDDAGPIEFSILTVAGRFSIRLRRETQGDVRVRYSVPVERLDKTGFRADGSRVLMLPEAYRSRAVSTLIELDPSAFGPDARAASSFGIGREIAIDASGDALGRATFVAGALGHAVFDGPEGLDRAAWLGPTVFDPRQVAAEVAGFRSGAREYFASRRQQPFMLLVHSDARPTGEFAASRRTASVLVEVGAAQQWTGALRLATAQQVLREWIGAELAVKPVDAGHPFEPAWLADGVNRSVARELLFRFGLLTPEEYLDEIEQLIALHVTSPVLRVPMRELATHPDRKSAETAVVVRGALFATLLDARIRERSKNAFSLDDLLRELFAAARARGGPLRPGLVSEAIANQLEPSAALELESRFLRGAETIVLPAHALGRCFRAKSANYPVFSLGFTPGGERAGDVAPGGPAARAGLKSHERIRNLRYAPGRTDVRVVVSVERGDKWQELSYLPVAGTVRGQGFARVPGIPDEHCALRGKP